MAPKTPSTNRFLLGLVRPYRGRLLLGAFITLLTTLLMLSLPQLLRRMFDSALLTHDRVALAELAALMMLVVALMVAGVFIRVWLTTQTVNLMFLELRNRLAEKVLGLDVAFFETRSSGELLSRMVSDGTVVREFVLTATPVLVRGTFLTLGTLVALGLTSPKLTLLLLIAALPMVLAVKAIGKKLKVFGRLQQDNIGRYSAIIEEAVFHVRAVTSYGQRDSTRRKLEESIYEIMLVSNQNAFYKGLNIAVSVLLGFTALVGVVWVGGLDVMDGSLTLGQMMAFLLYLTFLADGASNLADFWPSLQTTQGAAERLVELLAEKPAIVEPETPRRLPKLGKKRARGVSFEGVGFAYPSRPEAQAADGVSFAVKAGQKAAIVGPSGAGKTTLFGLLLRFYDVQHGAVRIDGVDVRDLSFADLRAAVAVVAQEPAIFSATVKENVAYGKPGASDEEVWAALRVANADEFVAALPEGLETAVGEKGVQLSGGQRQRLAIARAVLVDAPILLLDEATSHLDAESERAVQQALERAGAGRTVITIAHRLSTVRAADVIYVMDKGRVAASGDHASLMRNSHLYKALSSLQME